MHPRWPKARNPSSPLVAEAAAIKGDLLEVKLRNDSAKGVTAFSLEYSFVYRDGSVLRRGNNMDYVFGLPFAREMGGADDPYAKVGAIKAGNVRYVELALLRAPDGENPMNITGSRVTAVVFDDATADGESEVLARIFTARQRDQRILSRWLPELEEAEKSDDPVQAMRSLSTRLGTEQDDPGAVSGVSGMQESLKQTVTSWIRFIEARGTPSTGELTVFDRMRSMQRSLSVHSRRNEIRGGVGR